MIQNLLIALALAMDCFAVSVVCAVILRRKAVGIMLRLAFLFGLFQALMPLIGWLLASFLQEQIEAYDHWVAFAMLAFIGGKMIRDSFKKEEEASMNPEDWTTGLLLAIATSIDALAVGISYACTGYDTLTSLAAPLLIIGAVSFLMSILGYLLGYRFGEAVNRKVRPELLGGIILIGIGLRILAEHLGLLAALFPAQEVIPQAPDYTQESAWYKVDRGARADIFYIASTETQDYQLDGKPCHCANATDTTSCQGITHEMKGIDARIGGELNFYSPYYRQVTMQTYLEEDLLEKRIPLALEDVRAAFQQYLQESDRPFVLVGFSQGAHLVRELLKEMPQDLYRDRMVATYVIGWYVSTDDLAQYPQLVPATGATDTGVTVCYNTVRDAQGINPIISGRTAQGINPVSWTLDSTQVTLSNGLTGHLDPETHHMFVEGYTDTDYILPPYFQEGCYHHFEVLWYSDSVRDNIRDRVEAFLKP